MSFSCFFPLSIIATFNISIFLFVCFFFVLICFCFDLFFFVLICFCFGGGVLFFLVFLVHLFIFMSSVNILYLCFVFVTISSAPNRTNM